MKWSLLVSFLIFVPGLCCAGGTEAVGRVAASLAHLEAVVSALPTHIVAPARLLRAHHLLAEAKEHFMFVTQRGDVEKEEARLSELGRLIENIAVALEAGTSSTSFAQELIRVGGSLEESSLVRSGDPFKQAWQRLYYDVALASQALTTQTRSPRRTKQEFSQKRYHAIIGIALGSLVGSVLVAAVGVRLWRNYKAKNSPGCE